VRIRPLPDSTMIAMRVGLMRTVVRQPVLWNFLSPAQTAFVA
jgi:hypothetical protein